MELFASCAPGLEYVLEHEGRLLGLPGAKAVEGGMEFTGGWSDVARANLHLRTASRVLMRVASFPAVSFPEFERKLRKIPWGEWIDPGDRVAASVVCRKSKLRHTGKLAQMVVREALAVVGEGRDAGEEVTVHLRFVRDLAAVSVDTSGAHLHRRGYRALAGEAPIRENLAAACLVALRYTGGEPLLDPCCGSGTFAVEAAMIARNLAPGRRRTFAFERFPAFDPAMMKALRERAAEEERPASANPIFASDLDPEAVALALASARAAGVEADVEVTRADLRDLRPPTPTGLLVANPPYGLRLGGGVYAALAALLAGGFAPWRWGLLECNRKGMGRVRGGGSPALEFMGGGLPLRLIPGGARRE